VRHFGRYELIEQIAAGGMAEIWLARQYGLPDFHRIVVVKKLNEDLKESETFVRMFLDEARTSAQLTHPNVVQIYDLGFKDGEYFIAMEYIHGEDLVEITHSAVETEQLIPIGHVVRIVADALKGFHHAHTLVGTDGRPLGIVHRDVSPHNVLVSYDGMVKLVDFGIAKARTQTEVTGSGMLKGKHAYMSPEQVRGDPVDHRSDIFTIGIVLYELSTGHRLFVGRNEVETLEAVLQAPIPRPSMRAADFPEKLDAIIMRALERDPERRYQSAQEMQLELERSIPNVPGSAELGAFMHRLFGPIADEKQKVLTFLRRGGALSWEEWDREEEQPPPLVLARRSSLEVPTDVFVRKTRKHLAVGATKPGAKKPWLVRGPLIVRMIAARAPVRFKRPLAMVLAGPMVGVALVAAAAPIGVWLAGAGPTTAIAQLPSAGPETTAPPPKQRPEHRARARVFMQSRPFGARVYEGEELIGVTPLVKSYLPGTVLHLRMEKAGMTGAETTLIVGDTDVSISLRLLERAPSTP
jgi:serine/threonine-protein kinase